MRLEIIGWKEAYTTWIASFSKPIKCLCGLQIFPFSILKVVIKSYLKFALVCHFPAEKRTWTSMT